MNKGKRCIWDPTIERQKVQMAPSRKRQKVHIFLSTERQKENMGPQYWEAEGTKSPQ